MTSLSYGCNVVDSVTSGSYTYYLYSRIDNYALIARSKDSNGEILYYIIGEGNIDTDWSNYSSLTYVRPDQLSNQLKKYIIRKYLDFIKGSERVIESW